MPLTIGGQEIRSIAVVDDDQAARETYGESVAELEAEPYLEQGPIKDTDQFLERLVRRAQAIVCDYHLRKKNYASSNGDRIVKRCYLMGFPAILCTSFSDVDITLSRSERRFIPVLTSYREINPDSIALGIERCLQEYAGKFSPTREPTRTLVRIDEIVKEEKYLYVVVPGWDPSERVRLFFEDVPNEVLPAILGGKKRLHTEANVGAERPEDLYLDSSKWELQ